MQETQAIHFLRNAETKVNILKKILVAVNQINNKNLLFKFKILDKYKPRVYFCTMTE